MQGNKHIKNILAGFEAEPSAEVWEKVNERLNHDDRNRKRWLMVYWMLVMDSF